MKQIIPLRFLPLPLIALLTSLPAPAKADISGLFPPWLTCIKSCQPLWSINFDCEQAGLSDRSCLCESPWAEAFYDGGTCSCSSAADAKEFQTWFQGSNGCDVWIEERKISSSIAATATTTEDITSTTTEEDETSTTSKRTTSSKSSTTRRPSSTESDVETTITSGSSTITTRIPVTRTSGSLPTETDPDLRDDEDDKESQPLINDGNKKWAIPTMAVGGLAVLAGIGFLLFYLCRRGGRRGRYQSTLNPGGGGGAEAAYLTSGSKKKSWFAFLPFIGRRKSGHRPISQNSGEMMVENGNGGYYSGGPYGNGNATEVDTGYYGAGGGRYPPPFGGQGGPNYQPYQHGAPLPPIDEVQSIAESQNHGPMDRGMGGPRGSAINPGGIGGRPISGVGAGAFGAGAAAGAAVVGAGLMTRGPGDRRSATSSLGRQSPLTPHRDEDELSAFSFENTGGNDTINAYSPVGSSGGGGPTYYPAPPMPAASYSQQVVMGPSGPFSPVSPPGPMGAGYVGAGLIGTALGSPRRQQQPEPRSPDDENFARRYDEIAAGVRGRPTGNNNGENRASWASTITPQSSSNSIRRKEVGGGGGSMEGLRGMTTSPPISTISSLSANSSGFGGGGGRLAGRGSGAHTGFPGSAGGSREAGSSRGGSATGANRRSGGPDYYEDYR